MVCFCSPDFAAYLERSIFIGWLAPLQSAPLPNLINANMVQLGTCSIAMRQAFLTSQASEHVFA